MRTTLGSTQRMGMTHIEATRKLVNLIPLPRHMYMPSPRMLIVAAGGVITVLVTGIFFHPMNAFSSTRSQSTAVSGSSSHTVYLSSARASVASASAAGAAAAPTSEMHIANNGLALLRGARVTEVSGDTIHITIPFGGAEFTWLLQTNSATKFITRTGEAESLADIQVGDIITTTGKLAVGGSEPIINVQFVHE